MRRKNEGMDFAGYGIALQHWARSGLLATLHSIIFINSSVCGTQADPICFCFLLMFARFFTLFPLAP